MDGPTLFWLSIGFGCLFALLIVYVIVGKVRQRRNPNAYNWRPEQDYDVVQSGESAMTPAWPRLVERNPKAQKKPDDD